MHVRSLPPQYGNVLTPPHGHIQQRPPPVHMPVSMQVPAPQQISLPAPTVKMESGPRKVPSYTFKTINLPSQNKQQQTFEMKVIGRPETNNIQNSPTFYVPQKLTEVPVKQIAQPFTPQKGEPVPTYPAQHDFSLQKKPEEVREVRDSRDPREDRAVSSQNYFNRYANGGKDESTVNATYQYQASEKPKSSSSNYMQSYYDGLAEPSRQTSAPASIPAATQLYSSSPSSSELQTQKSKISQLNLDLTKVSLEKGELILEVAELSRENSRLKKEMALLKEQMTSQPVIQIQRQDPVIDAELMEEIEAIKAREMELVKIKKQYMQIIEMKYYQEMKKVGDANSQLKIELQNMKFDLALAKESTREKQIKIDFMDKEIEALESKSISRSRAMREKVDLQLNDKNSEIETIQRTFASLETQYKAQKKQIADKDDFIAKYMTGRMGEDAQAMQLLIDKYNFYSRQQFENEASRDK